MKQAFYRGATNNLPDQVGFQPFSSCSASNMLSAYSGEKSYQRQLSVSVESQGINSSIIIHSLLDIILFCHNYS